MSQEDHETRNQAPPTQLLPPLDSAADVRECDLVRAITDGSIAWTIKYQGEKRAPNQRSVWRHQLGLAGEIAAGTAMGVRVNWDIYDGYNGDDGYDFMHDRGRVEIKAVPRGGELELRVGKAKLAEADYFVLTRVSESFGMIELIGWLRNYEVAAFGEESPYDDLIRVKPKCLHHFDTGRGPISPEQIRAVQSL